MFNIGESVVVKYLDFKIIPSDRDPSKEIVQYKFSENGAEKYWKNGSSKIMSFFDETPKGSWVKLSRCPWLDKDGKVVEGKSNYEVEPTEEPKEDWSE